MKIWTCKIGETNNLAEGTDLPMRLAVENAYRAVTGREADFVFSGWGGQLDRYERAVIENREPAEPLGPALDRRQAAREACYDNLENPTAELGSALEVAIETATRVRITPEIIAAARAGWRAATGDWTTDPGPRETARLTAAFTAAGFEVEQ